ncbi:flavin reductase family protein [Comamonas sp. C11]|uniref:flavin reductase family protein n=1 Tax=Comamonas sp. C11 TaxID=2966554 RepID=UPI0021126D2E|nr:flavin reductase family protein [Comamonas sp. C11]UUC96742.1 flavin reductase family protein [Comamonas sp. C11]
MYFDTAQLDQKRCYKLLASTVVPRPIAWLITKNEAGQANAAPFSFFNFFSGFPPVICVGIGMKDGRPKDSLANIERSKEFVINLVSEELAEAMNVTATPFDPGVNELEKANVDVVRAQKMDIPRVAASPVTLECKLQQLIDVDTAAKIVVAHVVGMHILDEAIVDAERCYIDTSKLQLIGRMESPGWYTRTHDRFKLKQMSVAQWEKEQSAAV